MVLADSGPHHAAAGHRLAEHGYGPHLPRALEREYSGSDYATKEHAARGITPVVSLTRATGSDLPRSGRWDEVLAPAGIGDVAVLACRDRSGCWGWLEVYRAHGEPAFGGDDLRLLAQVGPVLGGVMRRGVTVVPVAPAGWTEPPSAGVLLLDRDLGLRGGTAAARDWVEALPAAGLFARWHILPPPAYAAATRARDGREASARALGRSEAGSWVQIEAARVAGTHDIAITIRAATTGETSDLIARAHGLTPRERQVVALLAAGQDTDDVARTLVISAWTVQDHLKSVFDKLGVHTRGGVLARLGGSTTAG